MDKNPNWQEANQLAIYKRGRGMELGATERQLQTLIAWPCTPPHLWTVSLYCLS